MEWCRGDSLGWNNTPCLVNNAQKIEQEKVQPCPGERVKVRYVEVPVDVKESACTRKVKCANAGTSGRLLP